MAGPLSCDNILENGGRQVGWDKKEVREEKIILYNSEKWIEAQAWNLGCVNTLQMLFTKVRDNHKSAL